MGRGSFTRRGGGRKTRSLPRKFVFIVFRRQGPWDFLRILPGCPGSHGGFKECVQKQVVLILRPPHRAAIGSYMDQIEGN